jgi:L-seryl-tRNA(Ser) seleniumtransferase
MSCPQVPPEGHEALRRLPAVDFFLRQPAVANLLDEYPRPELVRAVRQVLDECRAAIREGRPVDTSIAALGLAIRQKLHERSIPALRRTINATGIVLHTGLGRAPLCREAIEAIAEIAAGYCNLELDLASGGRGDRHEHLRPLLQELTAAEDGLVVNNNAAATYLVLNTLAAGREVIVSRGQLVEIGGSYRMPDIMAAAGCRMVEVGTTNRTRLSDYERAIGPQTAVLLRVHTSNYRIRGFVQQVELAELVSLGRRYGLIVVDDLGSGLLDRTLAGAGRGAVRPTVQGEGADETEPGTGEQVTFGPTEACEVPAPADWDEPTVRESSLGAGI